MMSGSHSPKNTKVFLCRSILSILNQKNAPNTKGLHWCTPIIWHPLFPVNGTLQSLGASLTSGAGPDRHDSNSYLLPVYPPTHLIQSLGKLLYLKNPLLSSRIKNLHSKLVALHRSVEEKYSKFCKCCQGPPTFKSRLSIIFINNSKEQPQKAILKWGYIFFSQLLGLALHFWVEWRLAQWISSPVTVNSTNN